MRLSQSFFFRDFLYSEISGIHGIANIPHDPAVNACGNQHKLNCAPNEKNRAAHIWMSATPAAAWARPLASSSQVRRALCRNRRLDAAGMVDP